MKPYCTNPEWVGRAKCAVCDVRNFVLFSGLSQAELDGVLKPIDNLHVPAQARLYERNDPATSLYTVRSGLIKLEVDLPNGGERIVRLLRPGDVAGLEALVSETYRHTAIALHDADVCRIPREVVMHFANTNPKVHLALMERWQRSIDQADHCIVGLSTGSAEARMARLLLSFVCATDAVDASIPSREEIGAMLGITTETASRIIADFRRRGLIHIEKGECIACNRQEMARVAEG